MILEVICSTAKSRLSLACVVALPFILLACSKAPAPDADQQARKSTALSREGPLLAYLFEGHVWTISIAGNDAKTTIPAPAEGSIDEFIWSADGNSLYFVNGLRVFAVGVDSGKQTEVGTLETPEGTTVEKLEPSKDPTRIIVHASDAYALPHVYSFSVEQKRTEELTIDKYSAMAVSKPPVIRSVTDLSVSPDASRVLFVGTAGTNEDLFVASLETGVRVQVTSLAALDGFEVSAEIEGGRRLLESAWSPDGRHIIFTPVQSCSESGLCYGQLFVTDAWTGAQARLSQGMMVGLAASWDGDGKNLVFEDAGKIMITTTSGQTKFLAEGNRARWQPRR